MSSLVVALALCDFENMLRTCEEAKLYESSVYFLKRESGKNNRINDYNLVPINHNTSSNNNDDTSLPNVDDVINLHDNTRIAETPDEIEEFEALQATSTPRKFATMVQTQSWQDTKAADCSDKEKSTLETIEEEAVVKPETFYSARTFLDLGANIKNYQFFEPATLPQESQEILDNRYRKPNESVQLEEVDVCGCCGFEMPKNIE